MGERMAADPEQLVAVGDPFTTAPQVAQATTMVATALIEPDEQNMRTALGDVSELAQSISELGVLQPLLVRSKPGGCYRLVAGHRRLAGAVEAGLAEVPVLVLGELDDTQRDLVMLVENLQREDLSPIEEARGYERVLTRGVPGGQSGLARKIGRSQGHISKRLALLELSEEALVAVEAGKLSVADAARLVPLAAWPERIGAVLASVQRYPGMSVASEARRQLNEAEEAERLAARVEALRAGGVPEVAGNVGFSEQSGPCPLGWLGISEEEHAGLPCHAWRISHRGLTTVCTDPGAHRSDDDQEDQPAGVVVMAEPSWRIEQRRRQAEHEAASARKEASGARRLAFAAELVRRSESCAPTFSARMWLLGAGSESLPRLATVAQVLGRESTVAAIGDDDSVPEHDSAVIVESMFGSDSQRAAERVLYATALVAGESIATGWLDTDEDMAAARLYLEHLQEAGFVFCEDEDELVAKLTEKELGAEGAGEEAVNA